MTSQISERSPENQQNQRQSTGKIFKGTINDAPMKVRVASIPGKFQNIIYRNNKTPAFGNSRERFYSQTQNLKKHQPGPGNYENLYKTQQKIFSKKGYGSLISNTKLDRLEKKYTGLPGPGSYDPKQSLLSRAKRSNSLALLSSKIQGHDLFKTELQKSKQIPGPGVYELRLKRSSSQVHPFFNNISRFDNSIHNDETPGVGHYLYNTSSLQKHQNSQSQKVEYKKPGPEINEVSYQQKLKVVRQILNSTKKNLLDTENVGPGTYNLQPMDSKIGFKIHETSYNRFGESINKNILTEKLKEKAGVSEEFQTSIFVSDEKSNTLTQPKESLSSTKALTSMFKSNIERYDFVKENINDPGRYQPEKSEKKSHLVNFEKKWV